MRVTFNILSMVVKTAQIQSILPLIKSSSVLKSVDMHPHQSISSFFPIVMKQIMSSDRHVRLQISQGTGMTPRDRDSDDYGPGLRIALPVITFTPHRRASSRPRLSNRCVRLRSPTLVEVDNSLGSKLILKTRSKSACRMARSKCDIGEENKCKDQGESRCKTKEKKQGSGFAAMLFLSQARKKKSMDAVELTAVKLASPARSPAIMVGRQGSKVWSVRQSIRRTIEAGPSRGFDLDHKEARRLALYWL